MLKGKIIQIRSIYKQLEKYSNVYYWLYKQLVSLNKKAVINVFLTSNISFLFQIGNIVLFALVLQALLGTVEYNFQVILICVFLVSSLYNILSYITKVQQAKLAINIQKKIHQDILLNISKLKLSNSEAKKLANRGARLTGQAVDDIFHFINYSLYAFLVSIIMFYLDSFIFIWTLITIICMLPLVYMSKKNTNRISKKFFHSSSEALSSAFNKQFKSLKFNPTATKFRYYFKVFYEYKIVSEKLSFSTKTMQVAVLTTVLFLIYRAVLSDELLGAEPIIYLFLIKNFSGYLQHIFDAINNLIKYYTLAESIKFNIEQIKKNE